MATIASRSAARSTHSVIPTKRGEIMAKKALIVAATAALALITMRLVGYPRSRKRHGPRLARSDISPADLELRREDAGRAAAGVPAELFLQRSTTDKAARQALKNKDFQRALSDPAVRGARIARRSGSDRRDGRCEYWRKQDALSVKLDALSLSMRRSQRHSKPVPHCVWRLCHPRSWPPSVRAMRSAPFLPSRIL